jgi:predicted DCC family thiol-disulfide oxidoreductase YuxK
MNFKELKDPLVIYDGECKFCHWNVNMILHYEKDDRLKFAWLQSEHVTDWLKQNNVSVDMDTFLVFDQGTFYTKSDAALKVSKYLKFPGSLIKAIKVLPRIWRNACYDLVARNRKKIMGSTSCALPIGLESRFLT